MCHAARAGTAANTLVLETEANNHPVIQQSSNFCLQPNTSTKLLTMLLIFLGASKKQQRCEKCALFLTSPFSFLFSSFPDVFAQFFSWLCPPMQAISASCKKSALLILLNSEFTCKTTHFQSCFPVVLQLHQTHPKGFRNPATATRCRLVRAKAKLQTSSRRCPATCGCLALRSFTH